MISFQSTLFAIFPVIVKSVDLKKLFSTSEDPVDVHCRWILFTYAIGFIFVVSACHVYAAMVRPEKRQYTYSLNPTTGQVQTEYTM